MGDAMLCYPWMRSRFRLLFVMSVLDPADYKWNMEFTRTRYVCFCVMKCVSAIFTFEDVFIIWSQWDWGYTGHWIRQIACTSDDAHSGVHTGAFKELWWCFRRVTSGSGRGPCRSPGSASSTRHCGRPRTSSQSIRVRPPAHIDKLSVAQLV